MKGLTNYITERPWSDIITEWYVRVDDTYQAQVTKRGFRFGPVAQNRSWRTVRSSPFRWSSKPSFKAMKK